MATAQLGDLGLCAGYGLRDPEIFSQPRNMIPLEEEFLVSRQPDGNLRFSGEVLVELTVQAFFHKDDASNPERHGLLHAIVINYDGETGIALVDGIASMRFWGIYSPTRQDVLHTEVLPIGGVPYLVEEKGDCTHRAHAITMRRRNYGAARAREAWSGLNTSDRILGQQERH